MPNADVRASTTPRQDSPGPLTSLVDTFFDGSTERVVAALLGPDGANVSADELERIARLVADARKEGER